ncbi:MAG: hypothetical protein IJD51_03240 [Clostridia bacterium]|nr:hypothetical protein [Clostridia bacterium]
MKKFLSLLLALAILTASMLTLASCGEPENEGAHVSVYLGDPIYDFDPSDYYVDNNAAQLMSLLYEPLFTLDEKGELVNAAAKKYEVNEEERLIEITLRETYWSDGTRVTADDFLYAWRNLLLEPGKANPAAALLYDIENALEVKRGTLSSSELGIEANLYDLKIYYRDGADYEQLLKNLAAVECSPVRQDATIAASSYWAKSASTIYTNGPFALSTLDYDEGLIILERNLGYHQSPQKTDYDNNVAPHSLVSFFTMDGHTVDVEYKDIGNTVFYMGDASIADRKTYGAAATLTDTLSTYSYVFNTENPLFADKNVRYALSIAIDRQAIIDEIVFGKAATGLLSSKANAGVEQELLSKNSKLAEARDLLASVDFGSLEKAFTLTVNNDEQSRKIADLVAATWRQLGFDVTVKNATYVKSAQEDFSTNSTVEFYDSELQYIVKEASFGNREFDVIGIDWALYSSDPFVALASFTSDFNGNGAVFKDATTTYRSNISGWTSESYDALVSAAYNAEDEASRNDKLKSAEALLISEAPIAPIVFNQNFAIVDETLSGCEIDGFGYFVFTNLAQKDYELYLPKEN